MKECLINLIGNTNKSHKSFQNFHEMIWYHFTVDYSYQFTAKFGSPLSFSYVFDADILPL